MDLIAPVMVGTEKYFHGRTHSLLDVDSRHSQPSLELKSRVGVTIFKIIGLAEERRQSHI